MQRVTAVWSGFIGAPGYSSFYFDGPLGGIGENNLTAQAHVDDVRTFFAAVASFIPSVVTIQVDPNVAEIDETTGVLTNEGAATSPLPVVGGTANPYSAPSGACISWRTATIVAGKRLRGRTFLVPLAANAYQSDGTLTPICISDLQAAAEGLLGQDAGPLSSALVVWHRPVNGAGGALGRVTAATVPDKAAVLRSRRD